MFKDSPEGQTHSFNDGCGEKEHNPTKPMEQREKKSSCCGAEVIELENDDKDYFDACSKCGKAQIQINFLYELLNKK